MPGDRDNKMIMGAFLQAANCSNYAASWRHSASDPGFLSARFYQEIARTLEAGKFHFGFIDDRLAMPSRYNDSVDDTVRLRPNGCRATRIEKEAPTVKRCGPHRLCTGAAVRHLCRQHVGAICEIERHGSPYISRTVSS